MSLQVLTPSGHPKRLSEAVKFKFKFIISIMIVFFDSILAPQSTRKLPGSLGASVGEGVSTSMEGTFRNIWDKLLLLLLLLLFLSLLTLIRSPSPGAFNFNTASVRRRFLKLSCF